MLEMSLKPNQKKSFKNRLFFLFSTFLVIIFFLLFMIANIQVVQKDKYKKFAQGQAERRIPLRAVRGRIFDKDGDVIVDNKQAYSLYITPAYFPKDNKKEGAERKRLLEYLSSKDKLGISIEDIVRKITIKNHKKKNKYTPVLIKRDLKERVYTEIFENKTQFRGIEVDDVPIRRYLMKKNLSHVLGYTGMISPIEWERHNIPKQIESVIFQNDILDKIRNNKNKKLMLSLYQKDMNKEFYILKKSLGSDSVKKIVAILKSVRYKINKNRSDNPYRSKNIIIGKSGLEKYQDKILRGKDGLAVQHKNSIGQPISGTRRVIRESQAGKNIYLTIDKDLQRVAKETMRNKTGVIIVSKPATGEILALVSNPSFDPAIFISRERNQIQKIRNNPNNPLYNRVLQGRYPPGSIFKIVVALAALANGVSPKKKYVCTGEYRLGKRVFRCHGVHGSIDMIKAIEISCNSYFYHTGASLTWNKIYQFAQRFGLGEVHSLETGSTIESRLPNAQWKKKMFKEAWFPGDTINHSIGQGYTLLSPIDIHNIISAMANNGIINKLYLIKKIENPATKEVVETKPKKIRKLKIKKASLDAINKALRGVVSNGTARLANYSKKYLIAGKTGTAQNIIGKPPHAWFTCYAPFNDIEPPSERIAVTVIVETLDGGGGYIAAPIATAIIKWYFEKTSLEETEAEMNKLIVDSTGDDEEDEGDELDPERLVDGEVIYTYQILEEEAKELEKIKKESDKQRALLNKRNKTKPILNRKKDLDKAKKQSASDKANKKAQAEKDRQNIYKNKIKREEQDRLAKEKKSRSMSIKDKGKPKKKDRKGLQKRKAEEINKRILDKRKRESQRKKERLQKEKERLRKKEKKERERARRLRLQNERRFLTREQQQTKVKTEKKNKKDLPKPFSIVPKKKPKKKKNTTETEENRRLRLLLKREEEKIKRKFEHELNE